MNLPIRVRLTAIYCAAFCLGAAILETGAYTALKLAVFAVADRDLNARLTGVVGFLNEHVTRLPLVRLRKEIGSHAALQPDLLLIRTVDGQFIFEGPSMAAYGSEKAGERSRAWTGGNTQRTLRLLAVQRTIQEQPYQLLLAADLTVPLTVVYGFGWLLLLSCPVLIAAAAVVGHWTAGRALAPVLAITKAARVIDAPDLSRRIAVPQSRDELRYLAETLNGMLARIENAFRKTSEFTANASHELRTPLAVIRANAEVALMRPFEAEADRAALRQILREAERNTALLEDLLRLARADSGSVALRLGPVDFAELVYATCGRCAPLAAARGVNLVSAPPSGSLNVSGDAEHLKRLLLILLDNAIKYTSPGGFIGVTVAEAKSGHVICEVTDTGIGISESDLPHIFERFFRSDRARTREEGGAGLGLAIADWIAGVHHGHIAVESTLGIGSVFRVALPLLSQNLGAPVALHDLRLMPLERGA